MKKISYAFWTLVLELMLLPRAGAFAQPAATPPASGGIQFSFPNPFKGGNTLYEFVRTLLNDVVLPIGGVIVVFFIIYSGFLFVTAQGDPGKLKTAKQNFLYVVIGSAILLGAWVISLAIKGTIDNLRNG